MDTVDNGLGIVISDNRNLFDFDNFVTSIYNPNLGGGGGHDKHRITEGDDHRIIETGERRITE